LDIDNILIAAYNSDYLWRLGDYQTCHAASKRRRDPVLYLHNTFRYPDSILGSMTKSSTIISGSRALEYFLPGSTDMSSAWDFYTISSMSNIDEMVSSLQQSGVIWESPDSRARRLLKGYEILSKVFMGSYIRYIPHIDNSKTIVSTIRDGLTEYMHLKDINEYVHQNKQCTVGDIKLVSINGTITVKGTIQAVKLYFPVDTEGAIISPIQIIKSFDISLTQCFITGYAAIHMYYKEACNRKCYVWASNYQDLYDSRNSSRLMRRYTTREFTEIDKNIDGIHRNLSDEGSMIIDFNPYIISSLSVYDSLMSILRTISWYEVDMGTVHVPGMIEASCMAILRTRIRYQSTLDGVRHDLHCPFNHRIISRRECVYPTMDTYFVSQPNCISYGLLTYILQGWNYPDAII